MGDTHAVLKLQSSVLPRVDNTQRKLRLTAELGRLSYDDLLVSKAQICQNVYINVNITTFRADHIVGTVTNILVIHYVLLTERLNGILAPKPQ